MATTADPAAPSRRRRIRAVLAPAEWRRAWALAVAIVALHVAGFGLLLVVVAPRDLALGSGAVFGVGLGITAYTLGMRHAFDADHIAAIDNVTRSLMAKGQRPLSVGFFFALGHSSVVFGLAALLAAGIRGLDGAVADEGSALQRTTGLIGPAISGAFLVLIGVLNLLVLVGIVRAFLRMRGDGGRRPAPPPPGGPMSRVLGRATGAVRRPWQMFPLGVLFGLGFDTATEVALLATAGAAAAGGLPFYAILCLPILFAAGMTLFDTLDGALMRAAYGWSASAPVRKAYYDIAITALSVAVALGIGTVELLAALADGLRLRGGAWDAVAALDLEYVGYAVVALFALTWAGAVAVWRLGRIEERWSAPAPDGGGRPP